jgi:hypothetical protein
MVDSSASSDGDPHVTFANGGSADLRGEHNKTLALVSTPNLAVNAI